MYSKIKYSLIFVSVHLFWDTMDIYIEILHLFLKFLLIFELKNFCLYNNCNNVCLYVCIYVYIYIYIYIQILHNNTK